MPVVGFQAVDWGYRLMPSSMKMASGEGGADSQWVQMGGIQWGGVPD